MQKHILTYPKPFLFLFLLSLGWTSCSPSGDSSQTISDIPNESRPYTLVVEAESLMGHSDPSLVDPSKTGTEVLLGEGDWLAIDPVFEKSGRYQVEIIAKPMGPDTTEIWLEDYYTNTDGRTYNVTGDLHHVGAERPAHFQVDGSPFRAGLHPMKLHVSQGKAAIDKVIFTLMIPHKASPVVMTQSMEGSEWELVWADEFEGVAIDTSKWSYDVGDWGWGNKELQYYTESKEENARIEEGALVIEAHKIENSDKWTSARLTTRGKVAFLYGKIEFRAKVPRKRGNWAAGWTLGNTYVDELDWPYCGEIDIIESVGYEVDDVTGDGIAHATVHTPAYYFKKGNQISSEKNVKNIAGEWHTYSVEWSPTELSIFLDGEAYYRYDKNANEAEWPFAIPQNLILNLAMGGGWGGARGVDPSMTNQKFEVDYVRVYQKIKQD